MTIAVVLCGLGATPAFAQNYKLALGGSLAVVTYPSEEGFSTIVGVAPLVRVRQRDGWTFATGFSWFTNNLQLGLPQTVGSSGGATTVGRLSVRPVMAGAGYTISRDRWSVTPSIVAGYSFNTIELNEDVARTYAPASLDIDHSAAFRPGVSVWYDATSRVGVNVFAGYLVTRPDVRFTSPAGRVERTLKADSIVLSVGAAVWVF